VILTPSGGQTVKPIESCSHIFGNLKVWTIFYLPRLLVIKCQITELIRIKATVVKITVLVCNW